MTSLDINDVISPPNDYIRRPKSVNLHTKRSEAGGRGSILHPQVTGDLNWFNKLNGVGKVTGKL